MGLIGKVQHYRSNLVAIIIHLYYLMILVILGINICNINEESVGGILKYAHSTFEV